MEHIISKNFNPENIEKYSVEFLSNKPFPHIIIDNFLTNECAEKIIDNFKLNKHWINYSFVNNFKKYGLTDKNHMNKICNELFQELNSNEFVSTLSKITGFKNIFLDLTLDRAGLHQIFDGGSLNIHTEHHSHTVEKTWRRVLNIMIYLNKNWIDKYNGDLEFWNEKIKYKVKSIPPIFNRCVIFQTDDKSFHGHPTKLNLPPDMSRKSITGYYFVDEEKVLELIPTRYVARPNDSFYYKFLINFEMFLNKIFSFLKRRRLISDEFVSKLLNLFK